MIGLGRGVGVALGLALAGWGLAAGSAVEERVHVLRVLDGDTLLVRDPAGTEERVRLLGVDTPELHHPARPPEFFAAEAQRFVASLVEGRGVRLRGDPQANPRDSYGRLLRYVILSDGRLLNAELVRLGYAHALTRFAFSERETFRAHEREARAAGRGLWAEGGLAAVRWSREHGVGPLAVHPMSDRRWAIEYAGFVKTRVPANQLVRQLNRLLAWIAEHDGSALERQLEANGYLRPQGGTSGAGEP